MNRFYWSAISNVERRKSISEISTIIGKYGFILAFQRFSDISMGITIEIEEGKVNSLYNNLKNIITIKDFENNITPSIMDCQVLIDITFTKGTGVLEIEVPAISE